MFSFIGITLGVACGIILGGVALTTLTLSLMFSPKLQSYLIDKYMKLIRKVEDKIDEEDF